ncbi:hypothetical protein [Pectobacterium brasiliense]|uniref:hypothetical protein n=2 Tax=Pectobacterium TaxID=122277 RepID=UPI0019692103|nr:hypothetical protein [Pectobacterium brasiliense]MBN3222076.1 hypothetical protein [Pectobacterium brasiliense]MBN3244190.1 hypothetical protein [Pectobacterium brasiliense]
MTRITLQQLDAQDGSCTLGLRHPWRKRFTLLSHYHRFRSTNRYLRPDHGSGRANKG